MIGAGLALVGCSVAFGWWLSDTMRVQGEDLVNRDAAAAAVAEMGERLERGDVSPGEPKRLLERLLVLGQEAEAIALLERMADRRPLQDDLRIMLAELRRSQKDAAGAERELRLILNRSPDHLEALQLITLVQLEQEEGAEAEARLRRAMKRREKGTRMPVGLLLADLLTRLGREGDAETIYRQLSQEQPNDVRPYLARAISLHDRGKVAEARRELEKARALEQTEQKALIDGLATSWGLEDLRRGGTRGAKEAPEASAASGGADG
jgi:Flp pilus assembly protein TadD